MRIEIENDNDTDIISDTIHDIEIGLSDLINENIDLRTEYEGIDFECDSALPANIYAQRFDSDISDIFVTLSVSLDDDNLIIASFTAIIDVVLQYNIAIDGHDYADGGSFSIGEIQKDFNEEIEVSGYFTIDVDGNDFEGSLDQVEYPEIDTRIDALSDYYDESEFHEESRYLMDFIQDETFSGSSILDEQLSISQKLLDEFENSHALNSMIHAGIISNLESYLSKKLIPLIAGEEYEKIQKTYSNSMTDKTQKIFSINDIVNEQLTPSKIILKNLIGKSFHDVKFIGNLLKNVFSLDINTESKDWLSNAITIRHDCVHRSGYDQSHNPVQVSKESNQTLIKNVQLLVQRLEVELPEKIKEKYGYDILPQEPTAII